MASVPAALVVAFFAVSAAMAAITVISLQLWRARQTVRRAGGAVLLLESAGISFGAVRGLASAWTSAEVVNASSWVETVGPAVLGITIGFVVWYLSGRRAAADL